LSRRWTFAWKFSFRAVGWLLAFLGGLLLFARLVIGLANNEAAAATFASFEVIVPLIAGLHAALLFAPDDEPALELLLAAPRPPIYLIHERLGILIVLQGGLALALSLFAAVTTPGANLLSIVLIWLPPSICIVGLCLLATLCARRMSFGVLTAIILCLAMVFGREVILPVFPNLWFLIFYIDPRAVTPDQYVVNRLFLVMAGVAAMALVVYRMRDEEALLGFQEAKNG
jgi:hypothetical protein